MKNKKITTIGLFVLLAVFILSSTALATDGMKDIKVLYQNIKIKINGAFKTAEQEPFIIDGTTYVPLRFVSEALGAQVGWDGATSTVTINLETTDSAEMALLKSELIQKQNEVAILKGQLDALRDEEEDEDEKINDLEDDLNKDYDELEDVEIDNIELDGDIDEIEVEIEVELDGDNLDYWEELDDDDIEDWLEDLTDDIQDALDEDTEIKGEIIDTEEDETIIEFEKDGDDDLDVEFDDDDYRDDSEDIKDVEKDLKGDVWEIDGYDFEIDYIDYDTDTDEIEVQLVDDSGDEIDEDDWDDLDSDDVEQDIEDICDYIADEFADEADVEADWVIIKIYDEDWNKLDEFEYDVEDQELN